MEAQLEEYRLRKRRKQTFEKFKERIGKMFSFGQQAADMEKLSTTVEIERDEKPSNGKAKDLPVSESEESLVVSSSEDEQAPASSSEKSQTEGPKERSKYLKYTLWTIYFLFWATCYAIAIELQFGVVFLMFSALLGIYFNTRTGPKRKDEVSAYSVFNKDFVAIDGTLKAEQFEREIRHGFNSVR